MKALLLKYLALLWIGGSTYVTIEVFYRGYSHWSMFVLAGLIFIICGLMNEVWDWSTGLFTQVIIGTILATIAEFITGCVVNLWLGWDVWDYSDVPFNLLGQICPQFMLLWIPLILIAIILDDVVRWKFFNEEAPRYRIGEEYIYFKNPLF